MPLTPDAEVPEAAEGEIAEQTLPLSNLGL
jgi:hypothetical protein